MMKINSSDEQCWILVGHLFESGLWWAVRRRYQRGMPVQVSMDWRWALEREERHGDVIGFLHTHPGMIASPSSRDIRTSRAWVTAFGKPVLCAILGVDGLRAHWFFDDESGPDEGDIEFAKQRRILIGVTPFEDESEPELPAAIEQHLEDLESIDGREQVHP